MQTPGQLVSAARAVNELARCSASARCRFCDPVPCRSTLQNSGSDPGSRSDPIRSRDQRRFQRTTSRGDAAPVRPSSSDTRALPPRRAPSRNAGSCHSPGTVAHLQTIDSRDEDTPLAGSAAHGERAVRGQRAPPSSEARMARPTLRDRWESTTTVVRQSRLPAWIDRRSGELGALVGEDHFHIGQRIFAPAERQRRVGDVDAADANRSQPAIPAGRQVESATSRTSRRTRRSNRRQSSRGRRLDRERSPHSP